MSSVETRDLRGLSAAVACQKEIVAADMIVVKRFPVLFRKLISAIVTADCEIEFAPFVVAQCSHWNIAREYVADRFRQVEYVAKKNPP